MCKFLPFTKQQNGQTDMFPWLSLLGGVIVGDSGLCCCVPVVRVTSNDPALFIPFVDGKELKESKCESNNSVLKMRLFNVVYIFLIDDI